VVVSNYISGCSVSVCGGSNLVLPSTYLFCPGFVLWWLGVVLLLLLELAVVWFGGRRRRNGGRRLSFFVVVVEYILLSYMG
jgi:hypothetical protein